MTLLSTGLAFSMSCKLNSSSKELKFIAETEDLRKQMASQHGAEVGGKIAQQHVFCRQDAEEGGHGTANTVGAASASGSQRQVDGGGDGAGVRWLLAGSLRVQPTDASA